MATQTAISAAARFGPGDSGQSWLRTFLPWTACVGLLALTGLVIGVFGAGLEDDPRRELFGPLPVAIVGLVGLFGVYLASQAGIPAAWDSRVSNRVRFAYPLAIGAALGVVSIGLELLTGGISFVVQDLGLERFHAPLPGSILFYSAGSVILEVIFRLLPIPLVLWVALRAGLPERHRLALFWAVAVLTSVLEPWGQTAVAIDAGRTDLALTQGALGFGYNLIQAYWFLRAGFLASLSVRWGHYAIWHILYGGIICAC